MQHSETVSLKRLPLSLSQMGVWLQLQAAPERAHQYQFGLHMRLNAPVDRAMFEAALQHVIDTSTALRARLVMRDGQPQQEIGSTSSGLYRCVDLTQESDAEQKAIELVETENTTLLSTAEGVYYSFILIKIGDTRFFWYFKYHHLFVDGYGMVLLSSRVADNYAKLVKGALLSDQDDWDDYCQYIESGAAYKASAQYERDRDYWSRYPTDEPVSLSYRHSGRMGGATIESRRLDIDDAKSLAPINALCSELRIGFPQMMIALTVLYLHRVTQSSIVKIGIPIHGRFDERARNLPAMCADVLPISFSIDSSLCIREYVQSINTQMADAFRYRRHRSEDIRSAANLKDRGNDALFRVMVNAIPKIRKLEFGNGNGDVVGAHPAYVDDLTVYIYYGQAGDIVSVILSGNKWLYSDWELDAHIDAIEALLHEVIEDRRCPISALSLLKQELRQKVLIEWNATEQLDQTGKCIHELFEQQVARTPDAVAVVQEDRQLTYAQLNARANQLAHYLRERGVGPDKLVAICVERSLELIVGLLGILKAGGAYVPLDPSYPQKRLEFMLNDASPHLLLTQEQARHLIPSSYTSIITIDRELDEIAKRADTNLDGAAVGVTPRHLAYLIYTSGSTGNPKGVMVEHANATNLLNAMQGTLDIDADDHMLAITTLSFDIAVLEIFCPLLIGARVILIDRASAADSSLLSAAIDNHAVSVLQATPATWQLLLNGQWQGRANLKALCGGEALTTHLSHQLQARVGTLWNLYGPTETTVWSCARSISDTQSSDQAIELIGRPISNTQIYILNGHLQPVPIGVTGEIYIGGAGVARGYLNRSELTTERFIPNPFSAAPNARMYKTGDLGRFRADGNIECQGRNDHQVKVRGFRIELGEIEARLTEHDGVREAIIVAREEALGDKRLVAYLTHRDQAIPTTESLRAHLKLTLPDYMVPSAFVTLDTLPLTPNGKVDRKALPAPELDAYASKQYEMPSGAIEVAIAGIWQELLHVERVGRHDHFFDLGGHSLLAVQMISRVRKVLGVEVALSQLFAHPVLAYFALDLANTGEGVLPAITPIARTRRLPLSFAQQRLWFLAQLGEATSEAYHTPIGLRLTGTLNSSALRQALGAIVARHEILRTRFVAIAGEPEQQIVEMKESECVLVEHDLCRDTDRDAQLRTLIQEEVRTGFNLERDPLIRCRLIRESDDVHVLLMTQHHIVTDGWSVGVLINELSELYGVFLRNGLDQRRPLPIQYADFAAWQRQWMTGELLQRQAEYWKNVLLDAPEVLELPTDRPRSLQQDFSGERIDFMWDSNLTSRITELSRRHGLTNFMTVLASWGVLLSRLSGQTDLLTGVATANRGRQELEALIGFFVNSLAIRFDVSGSPTVSEFLARVKAQALAALQHQDIPFEQVVELVRPERTLAHNPIFQVMFGWQNAPRGKLTLPGLERVQLIEMPQYTAKFDLSVSLWEADGQITGNLEYAATLFDRSTVERFLSHWRTLLKAMTADDQQAVDRLPLLTHQERQQILIEWNGTEKAYPRDRCVHALFEEQAIQAPRAVAVVQDERQLSYAELNHCANGLANQLNELGVRHGDRVVISLERSIELVVAELAILKCGAAYVPLDPTFPAERIAFISTDCDATIVLTMAGLEWPKELNPLTRVDIDLTQLVSHSAPPLAVSVDNDAVAYIMYTSGSTGKPKGVMIPQRGIKRLVLNNAYADFTSTDRVAFAANPAFDASTMEVWGALLNGGCVVVIDPHTFLDPHQFAKALRQKNITTLFITTALFNHYAASYPDAFSGLRFLLTGGERCDPASFARVIGASGPSHLIHCYGPTETTTFALTDKVKQVADGALSIPLGRPVSNTQLYLLDEHHEPVAIGVKGELYIGGDGVALGYLNQPELTAARFIANPFSADPIARMYKTGDLGRWLPDGRIEFLGRNDFQVKIRGFRIELGEIEQRLLDHEGVHEAIVLAQEDVADDKRLVAYLTLHNGYRPKEVSQLEAAQIAQWHELYEDTYGKDTTDSLTDFVGWNSSYTSKPIPLIEMQEWHANSLNRIASLKPKRVLEIGCGSGLMLLHLAPPCVEYVGTDFSEETLQRLRPKVSALQLNQVRLLHRTAEDFSDINVGSFDTIIINSVIQYFPDADYLLKVIEGALKALSPTGSLFIGDVRNLALLEAFHASVQVYRSAPTDLLAEIRERTHKAISTEKEFLVDPAFFFALKERFKSIGAVQVLPKLGTYANELTKYRYDVILHRCSLALPIEPAKNDWVTDILSASTFQSLLQEEPVDTRVITNIANVRIMADALAYEVLTEDAVPFDSTATLCDEQQRRAASISSIDPQQLTELAEELGYAVELSWGSTDRRGRYHTLLYKNASTSLSFPVDALPPVTQPVDIRSYTNSPLRDLIRHHVTESLKTTLKDQLPEYMIPAHFVFLDHLPLTPNGKIDRKALPAPELIRSDVDYVAPRTPTESIVASIWAEALKVDRMGIHDHFFDMGGHSLLAVQVIARLRGALKIEVALSELFSHPVLADFAAAVGSVEKPALPPITPSERTDQLRLSFAQQRLWFLAQLSKAASTAYHMPLGLRLHGELDRQALHRALNRIVARHEALRTTFVVVDGAPIQRIAASSSGFYLIEHDLRERNDATSELLRLQTEETTTPFDLEHGPLIRGRLIRESDNAHVLLITLHHILSDGWSLGLLVKELSTLYGAYASGNLDPLSPLLVQYADYAAWQHRWISGEVLQRQANYWTTQLKDAPSLLGLPTDHPRPVEQDYAGERIEYRLSAELVQGIKALAQRHGTTLYMTLLAGWAALLSRLTGQEEVLIGTPTANRGQHEVAELIGFFVNTLAVRVTVSSNLTVRSLLAQVKSTTLAALQHQDIPFEQVVELVRPERSLAHNPLVQVMFGLENTAKEIFSLPGLTVTLLPTTERLQSPFDLSISLRESGNSITGGVIYATSLFDRSTIERFLGHWRTLLQAMVTDDRQSVARLPILNDAELHLIVNTWNDTTAPYPSDRCIHELFEEQVEKTPDAIAVIHQDREIAYQELNSRANQLAHYLREHGVGPDKLVAVCVERGIEMIVGLLGILKAGGAYVPLDPSYPQERLEYMLYDAAPVAVLTQSSLKEVIATTGVEVIALDGDWTSISTRASSDLKINAMRLTSANLAYVIYTSGSTGQAKGVAIEHRNTANLIQWARSSQARDIFKYTLCATSLNFDLAVYEVFVPLTMGGRITVVLNTLEVSNKDAEITLINTVPSAISALLDNKMIPRCTRVVNLAGEALRRDLVERIFAISTVEAMCNLYGPSETTTYSTWIKLWRGSASDTSIGRPIANTQIYILDTHRQPVPIGVTGDIYIGGAGVARGYLNKPELTAERFIANPFSADPAARMYKTGDLGRFRVDGNIEFLGRNDHQVKIRGFRIELGEIEAQLTRHNQIKEAVVIAREDTPGDKRLIAYLTHREAVAPSIDSLRSHLKLTLPDYMIPSAFVMLDALPLTPNGKLDRKALPSPELSAFASRQYEAPQGEIEETLASIWQALLHIERVGRHDNFFDLGGHSLLTLHVINRLEQSSKTASVADLFKYPTIASLATHIASEKEETIDNEAILIRSGTDSNAPPLFLCHDGTGLLLYAHMLAPLLDDGTAVYGLPAALLTEANLGTVEKMADRLVRMIREVQSKGPYRLAGWSFGGLLAYEIAKQLLDQGEEVEFLGMFDTHYNPTVKLSAEYTQDAKGQLAHLVDVPAEEQPRYLARQRTYHDALIHYRASPIATHIHLFTAHNAEARTALERHLGWEHVLPSNQINALPVPGNHFSMMKPPNIECLAEMLSELLCEVTA